MQVTSSLNYWQGEFIYKPRAEGGEIGCAICSFQTFQQFQHPSVLVLNRLNASELKVGLKKNQNEVPMDTYGKTAGKTCV